MHIRQRKDGDAEALMGLWRRSVEATHHFLTRDDIEAIACDVPGFLRHVAELWVAEKEGRVAGFIGFEAGSIEMLFLEPAFRGQGIGTALVSHVRARHGLPLKVDVNEQNPEALGFYEHYGFRRVGRSLLDGQGRPFPLLHLRLEETG